MSEPTGILITSTDGKLMNDLIDWLASQDPRDGSTTLRLLDSSGWEDRFKTWWDNETEICARQGALDNFWSGVLERMIQDDGGAE